MEDPRRPHQHVRDRHLRYLFAADAKRGERLTAEAVSGRYRT